MKGVPSSSACSESNVFTMSVCLLFAGAGGGVFCTNSRNELRQTPYRPTARRVYYNWLQNFFPFGVSHPPPPLTQNWFMDIPVLIHMLRNNLSSVTGTTVAGGTPAVQIPDAFLSLCDVPPPKKPNCQPIAS